MINKNKCMFEWYEMVVSKFCLPISVIFIKTMFSYAFLFDGRSEVSPRIDFALVVGFFRLRVGLRCLSYLGVGFL